jgi:hypothetical protein
MKHLAGRSPGRSVKETDEVSAPDLEPCPVPNYDVTPDGRFVMLRREGRVHSLRVVLDWTDELEWIQAQRAAFTDGVCPSAKLPFEPSLGEEACSQQSPAAVDTQRVVLGFRIESSGPARPDE